MFKLLNKVKEELFDILLPKRCLGCGREGRYICQDCSLFISEASMIYPGGYLQGLVSIWEYEGLIKKLLFQIKYNGLKDAAGELVENAFSCLAKNEAHFYSFLAFLLNKDTSITYVPMEKKKEKKRGFNQAKLIANEIGKISGREVTPLLIKIRETPSQTDLDKEARLTNVKDAFESLENRSRENVVLVDDIFTTGATMRECSKILKKAGVKNIWGFTLARTV